MDSVEEAVDHAPLYKAVKRLPWKRRLGGRIPISFAAQRKKLERQRPPERPRKVKRCVAAEAKFFRIS